MPAELPPILQTLDPFRDRLLTIKGVHNKAKGDGDLHMRGMGCLLTGIELFPGNLQGGSDTPAGWSNGITIDQEINNHLQMRPETATRFGSLEFGVLDEVREDLAKVAQTLPAEDRRIPDEHATLVRSFAQEMSSHRVEVAHAVPKLEEGVVEQNNQMPILWTNERGEGDSHSHVDTPWVLGGDGLGFTMGRAADFAGVPHNRLLFALAHATGHTELTRFGNPDSCGDGPLTGLV